MSDDPFAEPSDTERTIIRPRPSGAAGRPAPSPSRAAPADDRPMVQTGTNKLVAAASPILAAAIRIAADRGRAPDIDRLRRAMVNAVKTFETEALATGMDTRSLRAARYAICATVDDMVLSTPWGANSGWAQQTMTSIFHSEVSGGERFFDILEQMQKDLGNNEPVVELMYLCVSLGMIGKYRVMPRGVAALTELREGVYRTIRQRRGDFERELSPRWKGIDAGAKPLTRRIPIWAMALGTLTLGCLMYIVFTFVLANVSEAAFSELFSLPPRGPITVVHAALPPLAAPVPAAAPPPAPTPAAQAVIRGSLAGKLRQFLAPEIRQGLVTVLDDAQTTTVRLSAPNMFGSGNSALNSTYVPLINRVGEALNDEPGQVLINGYTDDQPIHTARFPSNFELSKSRAEAVAGIVAPKLKDPKRIKVEGKGQAEPIGDNKTAEGRQQNRRTEIVLVRQSDAM